MTVWHHMLLEDSLIIRVFIKFYHIFLLLETHEDSMSIVFPILLRETTCSIKTSESHWIFLEYIHIHVTYLYRTAFAFVLEVEKCLIALFSQVSLTRSETASVYNYSGDCNRSGFIEVRLRIECDTYYLVILPVCLASDIVLCKDNPAYQSLLLEINRLSLWSNIYAPELFWLSRGKNRNQTQKRKKEN